MYSEELKDLGFVIFRQKSGKGIKPHVFVRFKSNEGKLLTFSVDTTRTASTQPQPDAYLITHAHSDHHGKSAMLSEKSWCSQETAKALEIRYEKEYKGSVFELGKTIEICGVRVQTFDVGHTPGSTAFFWENELGTKILITGDVKNPSLLPKCDVLLTEASYGDPNDPNCHFKDDIKSMRQIILSHQEEQNIALGAYEFGKSQKAVSLLREMGYAGPIAMNEKALSLTKNFVQNAGELVELGGGSYTGQIRAVSRSQTELAARIDGNRAAAQTRIYSYSYTEVSAASKSGSCGISIVPISELASFGPETRKYVLTCRSDYPFENIRISDHLDVDGLTQMVKDLSPKVTVVYHPDKSPRTDRFAEHLEKSGFKAYSINRIQNIADDVKINNAV
ncbi:MAG: MBL fold metallo-hydrolase [Methanosarcinales archaeon]|nr:MBL fold metallo-hydrolase [Methanosarcinales archaeon]